MTDTPTYVVHDGDGATTDFVFPFSWLKAGHVYAAVDGEVVSYTMPSAGVARIEPAPASGTNNVRVYRSTPTTPLITHPPASTILGDDLNKTALQAHYIAAEAKDIAEEAKVIASFAESGGVHTHPQSDITGLVTALAGKASTSHTHAQSDVTGLEAALSGKAATSHTHAIGDTTGLQTALDGKAATSHGTHVPIGGSTGQVLKKASAADGDVAWGADETGGGGGDLLATNNLSDLANAATARTNLGLGSAAQAASTDFAAAAHTHAFADLTAKPTDMAGYGMSTEGTKLSGIETAADVTDAGNVGAAIHGATAKTTPVDADTVPLIDSAASNVLKKVTWANIKATAKTYFDTLYAAVSHGHAQSDITNLTTDLAAKAPTSRSIGVSGLATGGGDLSANRTIGVPAEDAAGFRTGTATDEALTAGGVYGAADIVTLTDAATIAVDMATFINGTVTLGGNRTLGAPSNTKVGQSGTIYIVQDGTGNRTLAFHANWKAVGGVAPDIALTAGAVTALHYKVRSSTFIELSAAAGLA